MESYKARSQTVWDSKYHLVWITKYRYGVLSGDVGQRCRELLREIARSQEMTIYAGAINWGHVHMLIGIPPNLSVAKAVQFLKGKSSHKLLSEFPVLRKRYWGQHLWGRGYWVVSSGNVTDDVWQEYIENQMSGQKTKIAPLYIGGQTPFFGLRLDLLRKSEGIGRGWALGG